ncbi:hypothetical protein G8E10_11835 [Rhizobiaceae bacterium CRRU44]|uniref:Uncharacterized protein n=1 Tax=Ferranicluibacter rubi TaxID=2715133 RepID=A0AA44CCH0_9HYPH|nr:hypothetical protein [Ferranicluibacter rubi]NHT76431.1 hypothetical protein [Ferranicluibacter rubi]TCP90289.1 hypothetical protein C8J31_101124 [Rhizobium sp. PP-CC-2G-626]TCQ10224.1 hypothetical protein C8J34_102633 [Rhizobium sp. PP-F2F-G36]
MQPETISPVSSTAEQLRPVVITVVLAKIAVFALLMTTINYPVLPTLSTGDTLEIAAVR